MLTSDILFIGLMGLCVFTAITFLLMLISAFTVKPNAKCDICHTRIPTKHWGDSETLDSHGWATLGPGIHACPVCQPIVIHRIGLARKPDFQLRIIATPITEETGNPYQPPCS